MVICRSAISYLGMPVPGGRQQEVRRRPAVEVFAVDNLEGAAGGTDWMALLHPSSPRRDEETTSDAVSSPRRAR